MPFSLSQNDRNSQSSILGGALPPSIVPAANGAVLQSGKLYSLNYKAGVSGWCLNADGTVEINFGVPAQTGTVAPTSTPSTIGQIFCDTTAGKVYIATGTASSADWKILN